MCNAPLGTNRSQWTTETEIWRSNGTPCDKLSRPSCRKPVLAWPRHRLFSSARLTTEIAGSEEACFRCAGKPGAGLYVQVESSARRHGIRALPSLLRRASRECAARFTCLAWEKAGRQTAEQGGGHASLAARRGSEVFPGVLGSGSWAFTAPPPSRHIVSADLIGRFLFDLT